MKVAKENTALKRVDILNLQSKILISKYYTLEKKCLKTTIEYLVKNI